MADRVVACFGRYLREDARHVTRTAFKETVARTRTDKEFRADIAGLLRPGVAWDVDAAGRFVMEHLLVELPGEPCDGGRSQSIATKTT